MPDSVENNIETVLNGFALDGEEAEICDFSLEELNEVLESQGITPTVDPTHRPKLGETVTYIVAAVILNEQNEVLMMQEAKKSCAGKWYLPAGHMEPDETICAAAAREVLEETGLVVNTSTLLQVECARGCWIRFVVTGDVVGGTLKTPAQADKESLQAKWVANLDDLPLRAKDFIYLVDRARAFALARRTNDTTWHANILPSPKPHTYNLMRLVVVIKKRSTNRVHVLLSERTSWHLPVCQIHPMKSLHSTLRRFMVELFGAEVAKHRPHGLLSIEHQPDIAKDGICFTVLVVFRPPLEEVPIVEEQTMAEDKAAKESRPISNQKHNFSGKNGTRIANELTTIEKPRIGWQPPDMNQNIVRLINRRQLHESNERHLRRQTHFNRSLLNRLNVEHCLKGHEGCVNCLEWSKDGRVLASGSDDTQVRIWDPFANKCLNVVSTRHIGNIFSVKFIGDGSLVATGAGDQRIMVQSVNDTSNTVHLDCFCHTGRVKRLATCPDQPLLFWSAAEDGIAMQYDMRMPHECAKGSGTVFVDLSSMSDLKSIAVNPTKTHLIAIGADDCYIRLFDRRMVKTQKLKRRITGGDNSASSGGGGNHHDPDWLLTASPSTPTTPAPLTSTAETTAENHQSCSAFSPPSMQHPDASNGCVRYFAPGHLAKDGGGDQIHKLAATYITFDATGNLLLANMGGDHIYLFDLLESGSADTVSGCRLQVPTKAPKVSPVATITAWEQHECFDMEFADQHPGKSDMKIDMNISNSNANCGCEYIRRATSLYKRNWFGDVYASARDYYHVIKQYPRTLFAYRGLIKCLVTMRWHDEARSWIDYATRIFGDNNEMQERLHLREIFTQIESNEANRRDSAVYDSDPDDGRDRGLGYMYSSTPIRPRAAVPPVEKLLRQQAQDYISRYVGHCNTTTDIKEANFLGVDNRYISAGSDDGLIFFWDRDTGEIVNALQGDPSIVNCIQPHPSVCLLATSGIDKVVKIWAPDKEDGKSNANRRDAIKATTLNQQRMSLDPFETILVDMGVNISSRFPDHEQVIGIPNCNTS